MTVRHLWMKEEMKLMLTKQTLIAQRPILHLPKETNSYKPVQKLRQRRESPSENSYRKISQSHWLPFSTKVKPWMITQPALVTRKWNVRTSGPTCSVLSSLLSSSPSWLPSSKSWAKLLLLTPTSLTTRVGPKPTPLSAGNSQELWKPPSTVGQSRNILTTQKKLTQKMTSTSKLISTKTLRTW